MTNDSLIIQAREALKAVNDPETGRNVIAAGKISSLGANEEGTIKFSLEVGNLSKNESLDLLTAAKSAVQAITGASKVSAVATAHKAPTPPVSGHDNPMRINKKPVDPSAPTLPGIKHVIAIASGKGGVGKSTISANLALALARTGLKVGLMDADIYGPSLPTIFGLSDKPTMRDGKIVPIEAYDLKLMSIGLLVNADQALAWRGPMVMGAIRQLMNDVDWGPLDILIIDTPPGTGDAHLSLAQTKRLTGAVIVSTPQEMALADVRRGVALFNKTNVPILGIVENMAWFKDSTGAKNYLFGKSGAEETAKALSIPFLGAIPIVPEIREACDLGQPISSQMENHPSAELFQEICDKVLAALKA